ncbi:hypothetical protein CcCBS67573_g07074 [Chytriomyces confervae]|uniref:Cyclic nucleotide-binding domain-containing protein n=1 Tax=Chytriomyces confervae TaxID=246404 RepID=A0A507EZH4_9FUNG|nr:hypothetical protein CcCBS67573_g07074 [Chytriomyces confervae]
MPQAPLQNIDSIIFDLENVASYCQNALNQCQGVLDLLRATQGTRHARPLHHHTPVASNHQLPSSHQLPSNHHLSAGTSLLGGTSRDHDSRKSFVDLGIRWDAEDYNTNQGIEASIFDLSTKHRNGPPSNGAASAASTDSNCNLSGADQAGVIRRPTVKSIMINMRRSVGGHEPATTAPPASPVPPFANRKEKMTGLRGYAPDHHTSLQPNEYRWSGTSPTTSLGRIDKPTGLPSFAMEVIGVSDDSMHHKFKNATPKKSNDSFEVPQKSRSTIATVEVERVEPNTCSFVTGSAFRLPFIERTASFTSSVEVVCPDSARSEVLQGFHATALKIEEEEEMDSVVYPSPKGLTQHPSFSHSIHRSKDRPKGVSAASISLSPVDEKEESRLPPPRKSLVMTTLRRLPKKPRRPPAENFKWYYLWFLLPAYDHKGNYLQIESFEAKDLENLSFRRNGLHPRSIFNTSWDLLATVLFVLIVWFVPYFISFDIVEDHAFGISMITSVVFAVDALVSVFTPIPQIAPSTLCSTREYEMMRPSLGEWVKVKLLENLLFIPLAVYATFLGAISSATLSVNPAGRLYAQKVDELNDYVKWKNLSAETEKRLLRYYETKYRGKYFEEESLLAEMNESLRAEILLQNTKSLIENVPFLKRKENDGRDEIFMGRIATALRSQYYVEGDYVTKQGENGQDMFFILSGKLDVFVDGVKKVSLFDGAYIGEVALISKVLRTATVQAAKPSILYRLTYTDFHEVLSEFPDMKARIQALASEREQIVLARELSNVQAVEEEKE